ncbi:JmjC domain-containing protein [Streptomyces sp. NPDC059582]|uniref:JmjC domain-containing protein n=1 Tax=Streptomyces sp. NPDC059582 TaxID=3346875 RepID=UPI00369A6DC8
MTESTDCERSAFDFDEFFAAFWRKRPLFVPGGAADFLGRSWSPEDFAAARDRSLAERAGSVTERPGEVTFIEEVSAFDTDLAGRAADFARVFGAPRAWFDTVRTYGADGIGAHFDHSDNFVLQQTGVKEWSLAAPHHIRPETRARRMMNVPGVGGHGLPDTDVLRFRVSPGDLLYIPIFWLHSGVSEAESLSLSLVCPAVSLQSAVLPFLTQTAKSRALGHQPVPAFHAHMSADARAEAEETLRRATLALLERLTSGDVVAGTLRLQSEHLLNQLT